MYELVYLKLGGSLITDKAKPYALRPDKLNELAHEISSARSGNPNLQIVLGHGSGSFGHFAVKEHLAPQKFQQSRQHEAASGVSPYWLGFAEVWYRASQLNRYVVEALHEAHVPAISVVPSSSVRASDGKITDWDLSSIHAALEAGLVPLIYGDIVFDSSLGGVVLSTEVLMFYLAHHIPPQRILLAGLEAAVWSDFPERKVRLAKITPAIYEGMLKNIGGSQGTDVTGGMRAKVEEMLQLASDLPDARIQIFSGEEPGNLEKALRGDDLGTQISR